MPVLKGRDQIPINPDLERLVRVFKPSSGRGLQPEKRLSRTDALARRIHSPESIRKILGCLGLPCVRRQSRRSAIEFQNLPSHSCRQKTNQTPIRHASALACFRFWSPASSAGTASIYGLNPWATQLSLSLES